MVRLGFGQMVTNLLLVSFLCHQRKGHGVGCLRRFGAFGCSVSAGSLHRQWDIEDAFAFESSRLVAFGHHLLEFAVEFGFRFGVAFLFLAGNIDLLFLVRFAFAVLFRGRARCLDNKRMSISFLAF